MLYVFKLYVQSSSQIRNSMAHGLTFAIAIEEKKSLNELKNISSQKIYHPIHIHITFIFCPKGIIERNNSDWSRRVFGYIDVRGYEKVESNLSISRPMLQVHGSSTYAMVMIGLVAVNDGGELAHPEYLYATLRLCGANCDELMAMII